MIVGKITNLFQKLLITALITNRMSKHNGQLVNIVVKILFQIGE